MNDRSKQVVEKRKRTENLSQRNNASLAVIKTYFRETEKDAVVVAQIAN